MMDFLDELWDDFTDVFIRLVRFRGFFAALGVRDWLFLGIAVFVIAAIFVILTRT